MLKYTEDQLDAIETIENNKGIDELDIQVMRTGKNKDPDEVTLIRTISALPEEWTVIDDYIKKTDLKRSTFLIFNAVRKAKKDN